MKESEAFNYVYGLIEDNSIQESIYYKAIGISRQSWYNYKEKREIPLKNIDKAVSTINDIVGGAMPEKIKDTISITAIDIKVSAGVGMDIDSVHSVPTFKMDIDRNLVPRGVLSSDLRAVQVDGKSMLPNLMPDDWVLYIEDINNYKGEGMYVLNLGGMLMVKHVQFNPEVGGFDLISYNPAHKNYTVKSLDGDQTTFLLIGKVITTIQQ